MLTFYEDPKQEVYLSVMDYLFEEAVEFSLFIYNRNNYTEKAYNLYKELKPYITEVREIKDYWDRKPTLWTKKIFYFKVNQETKKILNKYNSNGFFSWISFDLLEDLCFYKEKRTLWFESIAHEEMCFIHNETDKDYEILKKIKGIEIVKESDREVE